MTNFTSDVIEKQNMQYFYNFQLKCFAKKANTLAYKRPSQKTFTSLERNSFHIFLRLQNIPIGGIHGHFWQTLHLN